MRYTPRDLSILGAGRHKPTAKGRLRSMTILALAITLAVLGYVALLVFRELPKRSTDPLCGVHLTLGRSAVLFSRAASGSTRC